MIFSDLAQDLTGSQHPLYALRDELLSEGKNVIDLVKGNANEHGIVFPPEILSEIMSRALEASRIYRPDPFGQPAAREAIARYYNSKKRAPKPEKTWQKASENTAGPPAASGRTEWTEPETPLSPGRIILTPGTSVSYWYCFKLLSEPDAEILCPTPSYPLLDFIARLSGVNLRYYRLTEDRDWRIDLDHLAAQIGRKTRAIVLISPHNPTGMVCSNSDLEQIAALACRHQLPIISDEVFAEFLFGLSHLPRAAATNAPLVFTLNGLSKSYALPGMKLGWIAVSGDEQLVRRSLSVLETISDTFLPVSEHTQFAAAGIFERGETFQKDYIHRVTALRDLAVELLEGASLVPPAGGFYLTLAVKQDEEKLALNLLADEKILLHPGYFYEMEENHLVMTFIHEPSGLKDCLSRIRQHL